MMMMKRNQHSLWRFLLRRFRIIAPLLAVVILAVGSIYLFIDHLSTRPREMVPLPDVVAEETERQMEQESAYQEALELAKEPENMSEALVAMRGLAPLTGPITNGYAEAHVWMAKRTLAAQSTPPAKSEESDPNQNSPTSDSTSEEAREHLRRAVRLDATHLEAHQMLVALQLAKGERAQAIAFLEKSIPKLPGLGFRLAVLLKESGEADEAQERAQAAAKHFQTLALAEENKPDHHASWALTQMFQGNYDEALEIIARGQSLHTEFQEFNALRQRIFTKQIEHALKSEQPNYDLVFEKLELLFAITPKNLQAVKTVGALVPIPSTRLRAKALLDRLLDLEATPVMTNLFLGDYEALEGRFIEAIAYYEAALQRAPKFTRAKNNIAWCLAQLDPPQLDKALALVDEALKDAEASGATADPTVFETRGQILFKLKRYRDAAADLERALRFMPDKTMRKVHETLSTIYQELGSPGLAETHARLAKGSKPD